MLAPPARGRDTRRRILLVGPLPPPIGGIQTAIAQLRASDLGRRYFIDDMVNTSSGRSPEFQGRFDIVNLGYVFRQSVELVCKILVHRPGIVQIESAGGLGLVKSCWFATLAKLLGTKVILSVHAGSGLATVPLWSRKFVEAILKRADAVRVLSKRWGEYFRAEAGLKNVVVIPNGVAISDEYSWAESENKQRPVHFLFVGRLEQLKGAFDLISAAALLAARKQNFRLELVGPWGSFESERYLRELVFSSGIEDKVTIHGEVQDPAKLNELYRCADVFVLPSYREGMPRAVLEAMSCGLPVIVTPVGALPEVVTERVNGLFVDPGDVEALAAAMEELARDDVLRARLGRKARETVSATFSLATELQGWEALYRAIWGAEASIDVRREL